MHTPMDSTPDLTDADTDTDTDTSGDDPVDDHAEVVVYWRPGCMFCSSLRRRLARAGLSTREVNIWDEPDGAAAVREAAGGNETVPTVAVGGQVLVNPPAEVVVDLAQKAGATLAPPEGGVLSRLWGR